MMGSGVKKLGRGANEVEFQVLRNGIDFKDGLGFCDLVRDRFTHKTYRRRCMEDFRFRNNKRFLECKI